jgi:probable HAF family extracellular repeat protein
MTPLASLIGPGGAAADINNDGAIVGSSPTGDGFTSHAVLWH